MNKTIFVPMNIGAKAARKLALDAFRKQYRVVKIVGHGKRSGFRYIDLEVDQEIPNVKLVADRSHVETAARIVHKNEATCDCIEHRVKRELAAAGVETGGLVSLDELRQLAIGGSR